ncbi:MAG: amidohydrolase family protein, partial [Clostridia bacterium]|nr:amidohydrolase family protein [Clostridia bacterium]
DKIAEKATKAIGNFYDIKMQKSSGTAENLILDGKPFGVTRYVVHSVATTSHQVRSINEFIKNEVTLHPEFIGFITLHPDLTSEEIEFEVNWAIENGLKGIKLHPDFQKFYIDGVDAEKIYKVVGNKLPILFHIGDDRYDFSEPARLVKMAKKYPSVRVISAHMGGYRCWDNYQIYKGLDNVYFDTCSSLEYISTEKAKEIITELGVDKFFFATDFPMWDTKAELERFYKIPLSDDEREKILSKNVKKFLNL